MNENKLNVPQHVQIPNVAFYGDPDKSYGWPYEGAETIFDALDKAKQWKLNAFHYYPILKHMYPCKAITGCASRTAENLCIGVIMELSSGDSSQ
jgi:hypothetical protein